MCMSVPCGNRTSAAWLALCSKMKWLWWPGLTELHNETHQHVPDLSHSCTASGTWGTKEMRERCRMRCGEEWGEDMKEMGNHVEEDTDAFLFSHLLVGSKSRWNNKCGNYSLFFRIACLQNSLASSLFPVSCRYQQTLEKRNKPALTDYCKLFSKNATSGHVSKFELHSYLYANVCDVDTLGKN